LTSPENPGMPGDAHILAGRYQLGELLGQGGMADVYRAQDLDQDTAVAVKLVRSTDADLARRLAQEAKALRRLQHPALVRLLDAGVSDGRPFLVMDLVEGPTLSQRLRSGPLGAATTAELAATMCGALAYVHEHGIVHRDVKPGNIMLGPDGRACLTDFGIASMADNSTLTATGTTLGTAAYMAPEQLEHHQVGPAADVWSLAMVLLECLIGQRVYQGNAVEVVTRRLSGPIPIPVDLPVPWRLVLAGMFDHDPARRPSAADVAAMVSAPAFSAAWLPTADRPPAAAGAGAPAVAMAETGSLAETAAMAGTALLPGIGLFGDHDLAALRDVDPTAMATTAISSGPPTTAAGRRSRWVAVGAAVAATALIVVIAALVGSSGPSHRTAATTGRASAPKSTRPITAKRSTTTTTTPSRTAATTALLTAVSGDAATGALSAGQAASISRDASAALIDVAAGSTTAAADDLDGAEGIVADAAASGSLTAGAAATLETDLAELAAAAGLPAPTVPTTTVPTTTAPTTTTPTTTKPAPSAPGGSPGPGNQGNGPKGGPKGPGN